MGNSIKSRLHLRKKKNHHLDQTTSDETNENTNPNPNESDQVATNQSAGTRVPVPDMSDSGNSPETTKDTKEA